MTTLRETRPKPGPLDYLSRWPLRLWVGATTLFLYAPLLTLIVFSFNQSKRNIVWRGFTLDYYAMVLQDTSLLTAFANSLVIAAVSTALSLCLGAATALLLWRFRFPFKPALEGALSLPIVVPEICMGVALLVFFTKVVPWPTYFPWPLNLGAIIIAHVSFNREEEEAARDLGASEGRTIMDVIVPHMRPALFAGGLLAFTLSLDDFVITFFTSGPDTITFPVKVFSMIRFSVTPEVNAASTLLIVITVALTAIGLRLQGADAGRDGHTG